MLLNDIKIMTFVIKVIRTQVKSISLINIYVLFLLKDEKNFIQEGKC